MKKIITICSLVLVLALVVTAFTACSDKTKNEPTTTTGEQGNVSGDIAGFTIELGDTEALVKKNGEEFQTLKYPINPNVTFDKNYAKEHCEFLDMNFDGQPDLYIAICSVDGVVHYYCWLYNATTNQFDYSVILSALKNISVDSEHHRILSTVKNGDSTLVVSYHWVDGDLVLENRYDESSVPEEITKVVEDNAIGINKPSTTLPSGDSKETTKKSENKPASSENSVSTTKANKPANTTTTKQHTGGVQLATGDMDEGWY